MAEKLFKGAICLLVGIAILSNAWIVSELRTVESTSQTRVISDLQPKNRVVEEVYHFGTHTGSVLIDASWAYIDGESVVTASAISYELPFIHDLDTVETSVLYDVEASTEYVVGGLDYKAVHALPVLLLWIIGLGLTIGGPVKYWGKLRIG